MTEKKRTKTVVQKIKRQGQSKFPLGLPQNGISSLSAKTLKRSWKKRDTFTKNLKNPKFRAKAKLKDYKSVL